MPLKFYAYPERCWEQVRRVEGRRALLKYLLIHAHWCCNEVADGVLETLLGAKQARCGYRHWLHLW